MTVNITFNKLIKEIQEEFNQLFPFLRIEFIRKGYNYQQPAQRKRPLPRTVTLGSVCNVATDNKIDITPALTVKDLEKRCEEQFGVSVQVYRRSGHIWLETTMTEDWTMKQQNDHGREIALQ